MERVLKHIETLVFYDGPQLIHAKDQLSTNYLCYLVDRDNNEDAYLCIPVSPSRLSNFLWGNIDLRSIVDSPETEDIYLGYCNAWNMSEISVILFDTLEIPTQWLPDTGIILDRQIESNENIIAEAINRNRAILHISLNPPEARDESKITVEHLGQAIKLFQRLTKYAFNKALSAVDDLTRTLINQPSNYELEVFSFSPGSFTVHMQSTALVGLWGYSQIEKAFLLLDNVNRNVNDPEETVNLISEYGGHFVTAYRDLVKFITDNDVPIKYEWTTPELKKSNPRKITTKQAEPIYDLIVKKKDITREVKIFRGPVVKVDVERGSWRIKNTDEDKEYSGTIDDPEKIRLDGITVTTRNYEFTCEEILEEERSTGKDRYSYHLLSFVESM